MARYVEIAMQVLKEQKERRKLEQTGDRGSPPWPAYNGGEQFHCEKCGTRFDTSVGFAKHQVYGCYYKPPAQAPARDMPKCPTCGSYCLCREKSGGLTCETCGGRAGLETDSGVTE